MIIIINAIKNIILRIILQLIKNMILIVVIIFLYLWIKYIKIKKNKNKTKNLYENDEYNDEDLNKILYNHKINTTKYEISHSIIDKDLISNDEFQSNDNSNKYK